MARIEGAVAAGGGGTSRWVLVGGEQSTDTPGWTTVGAAYVDPSKGPPTCTLHVVTETSDAGFPCVTRLYNADDAAGVGGAPGELSQAATVPTHATLALTAGVTAGFPNAARTYWLQIKLDGGAAPDLASCKSAVIEQG